MKPGWRFNLKHDVPLSLFEKRASETFPKIINLVHVRVKQRCYDSASAEDKQTR
jgi:hypothetical protein